MLRYIVLVGLVLSREIDQELADLAPNTVDADSIIMDNILTVVFAKSSPSLFPIHLEMTKDSNVTINESRGYGSGLSLLLM